MVAGGRFYRQYELQLVRDRSQAFSRSWTVMHSVTAQSPLFGYTPEKMSKEEVELLASVVGTDDTSLQPVHARDRYADTEILWGARHADVLSETEDGRIVLDLRRFDDVVATQPTPEFPYEYQPPRRA